MATRNRPRVPTVYVPDPTDSNKSTPMSKERIPFVQIPSAQIVKPNGQVDGETVARVLTQLQQNVHDATISHRSSPLNDFTIVRGVTLIKGTLKTIRHNLGSAFTSYHSVRAYATYTDASGNPQNSSPFSAVESSGNKDGNGAAQDESVYLVLNPSASGRYDIAIYT